MMELFLAKQLRKSQNLYVVLIYLPKPCLAASFLFLSLSTFNSSF